MKTYRTAILGCRSRGTEQARAHHQHPRTELAGICDLLPGRLDALGDELGVSGRYSDLDAMMAETAPDVVAIATGTEFHYDLAVRVLDYGVDVVLEKPMCVDLEQADALVAKAKEKGARLAVHHQGRVDHHMRPVARVVEEGGIGDVRYIAARGKGYYGGYGLMNIGTHLLNSIIKLTGHCRSVSATAITGGHAITPEDVLPSSSGMGTIAGEHITATLGFDGNVTANLLHHRAATVSSGGSHTELYGSAPRHAA